MTIYNLNKKTAVLTTTYVMQDGLPILYVSHDLDDEGGSIWQFHCGNGDYDMKKMLLVSLGSILNIDNELKGLHLEIGEEATRLNKDAEWKIGLQ